jgi:hypothetical protein
MAVPIKHTVKVDTTGLKRGKQFIQEELAKAGVTIGTHLTGKVRAKQRIDTGAERKGTQWKSRAVGSSLRVNVSNRLVQALVDETGARWSGSMPPFHAGSKLYKWVIRKGIASRLSGGQRRAVSARVRSNSRRAGASREESIAAGRQAVQETEAGREANIRSVTFLIARAISRRGLPRPGDPLRRPFEVTRNEERPFIVRTVNAAFARSVRRINS